MKKIILLLCTLSLCVATHAAGYAYSTTIFRPDDKEGDRDDMFDLDHHYAYTWGISTAVTGNGLNTYSGLKDQLKVGSGWSIDSVTLTFKDIWDWVVEPNDRLWVNLLDTNYTGNSNKDLKKGVRAFQDNADDIESTAAGANYFNNKGTALSSWTASNGTSGTGGYWTDPNGGNEHKKTDVTFTFTGSQISALITYINNGGATSGSTGYADFGLAFDPDCHYYNTGVELTVVTKKYYVPEGGASVAFLGAGLIAVTTLRRLWRR